MHDTDTARSFLSQASSSKDRACDMGDDPIAVVGASCRLPGAPSLEAFWELLTSDRDAIRQIGDDRWSTRFYGHPGNEAGKSYTWAAGTLDEIDAFDPAFFGISTREAEQMDPQQRLLLELAWEALEDAAIPAGRMRGEPVGVYVAASATEYLNLRFGDVSSADPYFMTGNTLSIFSNRLSYIFDLHGPSLTIDTACSSSLVALHVACEDIRRGKVPAALVGGVNLMLSPYPFIGFSQARMLSRRGRCFSFDARADGYVRGEGGGAVLLKPLWRAVADGDRVRGLILASSTNSDGRTIGLSLPNQGAQEALLRQVYGDSGIDPSRLAFVEAHGTGTAAGDPIETRAIGEALGRRRGQPLPIGSVKTNIGHLEAASGLAGLLKALLALEKRVLPKTRNFENPNPAIDFNGLNLAVASDPIDLTSMEGDLAGVSSFGFGGTNAHLVLAGAPPAFQNEAESQTPVPLLLSARSEAALRSLAVEWRNCLSSNDPARHGEMARAAARGRDHHVYRLALVQNPVDALDAFLEGRPARNAVSGVVRPGSASIAFVFSGNGAQFPGMARDALAASPAFRAALQPVDLILREFLGWSAIGRLEEGAPDIGRTDVAQPLLFAIQIGIVTVLRGLGIDAAASMGHSVGEISAAWATGALSLEDAARLVVIRSRHQHRTAGQGRMAVVRASPEELLEAADAIDAAVEIAAYNTTKSLTIAGQLGELERMGKEARRRGFAFTMLDLDYAFHSNVMAGIRDGLIDDLAGLMPRHGETAFVSTVDGKRLEGEALQPDYWWRNIREPVRFADAARALIEDGTGIFLEIGPSAVMQSYLRDVASEAASGAHVLPSLEKKPSDSDPFPGIAAGCYAAGYDWAQATIFDGPRSGARLPHYPWQRERHRFPHTTEAIHLVDPLTSHWLLGFQWRHDDGRWFNQLDTTLHPWLADHKVGESAVLPAAAIIDQAFAAAKSRQPDAPFFEIADLEIRRPVMLSGDRPRELSFRAEYQGRFELSSRMRFADEAWTGHASGQIERVDPEARFQTAALPPFNLAEGVLSIGSQALYLAAARFGLHYGPEFQVVESVTPVSPNEAWVTLRNAEAFPGSLIDPRLLDGALQGLLGLLGSRIADQDRQVVMLPWRFDRLKLARPADSQPTRAHLRIRNATDRAVVSDIVMLDREGRQVLSIEGCWLQPVQITRKRGLDQNIFHFVRVPASLEPLQLPQTGIAGHFADTGEFALLGEAFVASLAHRVIGRIAGENGIVSESAIEAAGGTAPLARSLLRLLERHDAATLSGQNTWQLGPAGDLPGATDIWRSLFYDAPDLPAVSALLAWAEVELEARLLLPSAEASEPPAALREQLLFGGRVGAWITDALIQALGLSDNVFQDRTLRVLDLDMSGGLVARRLLPAFEAMGIGVDYVVATDAAGLARATETVQTYPGARARLWDPSAEPNRLSERFDMVVAAQWLMAQPDGWTALDRLKRWLKPGGRFVGVEPAPHAMLDLILGLTAQGREGQPDWAGSSLLRSAIDWKHLLSDAGFGSPAVREISADPWPLLLISGDAPDPLKDDHEHGRVVIIADESSTLASKLRSHLMKSARLPIISTLAEFEAEPLSDATILLLPTRRKTADAQRLAEMAALTALAGSHRGELVLVTRGAGLESGTNVSPGDAALLGLARVAANEIPAIQCRRIGLSADLSDTEAAERLVREISQPDGENEVQLSKKGRFVPRLRQGLAAYSSMTGPVRLVQNEPGFLDSLRWAPFDPVAPGPGEVAIDIRAAGLNFRDVMWAMALLPGEALLDGFAGPSLGMECAGIVTAIGDGVDGLAVGDRVMAFAPAAFASTTITKTACVTRIPAEMDFEAAATMPVAFITVLYALGTLGRLRKGETVLIHGGAGGVGLAAIQYALHIGAEIVATAGSPAKRALLRQIGVHHVLNSRSLVFADEVMRLTGGKGVDLVLNSLSGDAMERSLGLMAPFGRFLELGKRDFYQSTRVSIRPLRHNVSYFAIDADELVARQPAIAAEVMAELRTLTEAGVLRPLPFVKMGFSAASEAFRLMRASGHIGKIILAAEPVRVATPIVEPAYAFPGDKTLIVTGGMTGFGLETAKYFVKSGARHVAILSRRGIDTPGAAAILASLHEAGAETAKAYACDVADEDALSGILIQIRRDMPPVGGVVHAAMVVADNLLGALREEEIGRVLRPKLFGAELLDRLTRQDPIELFLLFSSATTLLGAPGQGSYVAANMALEALAARRHAEGLPGLAVGWGPIADAGYLAERHAARDALARRLGAIPITAENALSSLPALLKSGLPAVAYAEVDWSLGKDHLPILAEPMFAGIADAGGRPDDGGIGESLAGKSPEEALEIVQTVLLDEIATILRVSRNDLDRNRPLTEIGMDSLMAVELKLGIEKRLKIEFPALALNDSVTIAAMAKRLVAKLDHSSETTADADIISQHEDADGVGLVANRLAASRVTEDVRL